MKTNCEGVILSTDYLVDNCVRPPRNLRQSVFQDKGTLIINTPSEYLRGQKFLDPKFFDGVAEFGRFFKFEALGGFAHIAL
jgi:hypothetical protein